MTLRRPLVLLAVLSLVSLAARGALLDEPCRRPCRPATDHTLVFDEAYYVNAARVIAGVRPPPGVPYASSPLGVDPNSEHPQLAKLVIAGSIELLGDGPPAWRLGSLLAGTLAIVGMFALARAAGATAGVALGGAALMAADNLELVHGRIGTLDVYTVTAMVWSATLYVRGRWLAAGVLVAVAACFKEVGAFMLLGFVLFEALRLRDPGVDGWPRALARAGGCAAGAAASFIALLAVLDRIATPYDPNARVRITGGPFSHLSHILDFSSAQTSPRGPTGIASYPWQWLFDFRPITYLNINPARPVRGLYGIHPAVHFLGMISPPILLVASPALVWAAWSLPRSTGTERQASPRLVQRVGLAWVLGTFVPFELMSLVWSRTSYLYYMVIVMPGIYLLVAEAVSRARQRSTLTLRLALAWAGSVLIAAVLMYPFTPLLV